MNDIRTVRSPPKLAKFATQPAIGIDGDQSPIPLSKNHSYIERLDEDNEQPDQPNLPGNALQIPVESYPETDSQQINSNMNMLSNNVLCIPVESNDDDSSSNPQFVEPKDFSTLPPLHLPNSSSRQDSFPGFSREPRTISLAARVIYIDRPQSSSQSNTSYSQTQAQPSLFAFRQESLRGSRLTRVPSTQEVPTLTLNNRAPSRFNLPAEPNDPRHIGHIDEAEEHLAENDDAQMRPANPTTNDAVIVIDNDEEDPNHQSQAAAAEEEAAAANGPNPGRQAQETEDLRIHKTALRRVLIQFIFNAIVLLANILALLFVEQVISVTVLFIVFLVVTALYIALLLKTGGLIEHKDNVTAALSIGNALSIVIFIIVCYISTQGSSVPVTPFSLFGILLTFGSCCKVSLETPSAGTMLLLIEKFVLWVQLFIIGLKVDGLDVPWSTVFIPMYFALIVLAFSSLLIIFGSLFAFVGIMREEGISTKLVVGSIWYILNAAYTGIWLYTLTQVIRLLEDNDQEWPEKDYMQGPLIAGIIHSGILLVYTLIFWKQLCKFQEFEVQSEMLTLPAVQGANMANITNAPGAPSANQVSFKVSKDNKTRLMMISPTFYSYFRKHVKGKKEKEEDKEVERLRREVAAAKLERYRQTLTLNAPIKSADPATTNLKKRVSSPPRGMHRRGLDFSANDIDLERQLPPQLGSVNALPSITNFKRMESNRNGENTCAICFDNLPNGVYMDCGHSGVCYECALETWKKSDACIMCRQPITKILKIVHVKKLNIVKVVESTKKVFEVQHVN